MFILSGHFNLFLQFFAQSPIQLDDVEAVIKEDTGYEADMSAADYVDAAHSSKHVSRVSVLTLASVLHKIKGPLCVEL